MTINLKNIYIKIDNRFWISSNINEKNTFRNIGLENNHGIFSYIFENQNFRIKNRNDSYFTYVCLRIKTSLSKMVNMSGKFFETLFKKAIKFNPEKKLKQILIRRSESKIEKWFWFARSIRFFFIFDSLGRIVLFLILIHFDSQ